MRRWTFLLPGLALLCLAPLAAQNAKLAKIDETAERLMKDWGVPGLALAVVDHGEVVLAKGYGFRDVERQLPVTAQTMFAIGSISKSFTVSVLNTLADEGKLDWRRPVREYLPSFRMYDPVATAEMTTMDLVTHRSGLPRHDALWYATEFTRKELFDKLRYLQPNRPFRETYQYQNLMFMTAGYLAGELAGDSWENLVRKRVFQPLGMSSSNFSVNESQKSPNHALPYGKTKDEVKRIPFHVIDEIGPAGSINSTVEDMARYVKMHLSRGKPVMSEKSWIAMTSPQMAMPGARSQAEIGDNAYGMGLSLTTYRGHKLVSHGGGIDGFSALLSFLPDDQMGLIILTNLNGNPAPGPLSFSVFDALLGLPPIDWAARQKAAANRPPGSRTEIAKVAGTQPSHALADYAGEFVHPGYGRIRVEAGPNGLRVQFHGTAADLTHFHYDVFEGRLRMTGDAPVKFLFRSGLSGKIDTIEAPLEPQVDNIVFTRVAAKP